MQYNSLIKDPQLYISSQNSKTSIRKETLNRKTGHQQRTDNQTGFLSTTEDVRGQWDHVFTFLKKLFSAQNSTSNLTINKYYDIIKIVLDMAQKVYFPHILSK